MTHIILVILISGCNSVEVQELAGKDQTKKQTVLVVLVVDSVYCIHSHYYLLVLRRILECVFCIHCDLFVLRTANNSPAIEVLFTGKNLLLWKKNLYFIFYFLFLLKQQ
jgi:hypothetical protein